MACMAQHPSEGWPEGDLQAYRQLMSTWQRALGGDQDAQAHWQVSEGGEWLWKSDGVRMRGNGAEWSAFNWDMCSTALLRGLASFVVEVTISGKAEAAGLSFGPHKDFMVGLESNMRTRHLQLEVHVRAGCWAFRVDGQLVHREWWDSAVGGVDDLVNGTLMLKGKRAEQALFQDLVVRPSHASCQLSVIMTCYRFLQRLRVSLRNWCHQGLPIGTYEVCVVNPNSPDGTHEYLMAVARSYPHVCVREVAVGSELATNKGAMINRAVDASRGEWIWLTDADCLFSPNCAAAVLDQLGGWTQHLFYGQRRYLSANQTDALLSGRIDGLHHFESLSKYSTLRTPENGPWGYTQIVHRSTLERVRYREELNHFAHSNGLFVEDCRRHGITPQQVDGLFCFHMEHPFAWYGTDTFL